jgi:hypothetical protein
MPASACVCAHVNVSMCLCVPCCMRALGSASDNIEFCDCVVVEFFRLCIGVSQPPRCAQVVPPICAARGTDNGAAHCRHRHKLHRRSWHHRKPSCLRASPALSNLPTNLHSRFLATACTPPASGHILMHASTRTRMGRRPVGHLARRQWGHLSRRPKWSGPPMFLLLLLQTSAPSTFDTLDSTRRGRVACRTLWRW